MSKELQIVEGLKHASEFRGRMLERKRIAELLRNHANTWRKTPIFNFPVELHKLAEAIEKGTNG